MTLTKDQQRNLKAQAHHLTPLTQIGKNGVTPEQITTIKNHLENHELIKIRFNDYKNQKQELATQITQQTQAEQIDLIGNTLIIYKQSTDPAKRKINPTTSK
jgi:RNA-binding protein